MVAHGKLIQKLRNQTLTKVELTTFLHQLGFARFGGKGSHEVWGRNDLPDVHIVIATHVKEVPRYQLRQIEKSLSKRGLL
ncbi:MAG: type II toxin-antitoxin system HicA family toxin [Deltaproteobacteria bacterium]|nr:type II toxin-antitoxin system HicA family toxin [Deltaproteobacteria bacterium]